MGSVEGERPRGTGQGLTGGEGAAGLKRSRPQAPRSPAGTDLSPAAHLPTSLPCMTCPTLEHQTLFCFFLFMQLIKVGSVACALPWPWEPVPGESTSVGRPGGKPSATGCPQKPAFLEHECRELTSQRRPSRFPGSLVPLLPEQPGGHACGATAGDAPGPTPGMCPASRTSLPGRGPLSLTLAYFPP